MTDLEKARAEINAVDSEMVKLFERRMAIVKDIAAFKKDNGLPVFDPEREARLLETNSARISDPALREYYASFLEKILELSKAYQRRELERMK